MNPGAGIIVWIFVGASAGWLASRILGTDAQRGVFGWHARPRRQA